MPPASAAVPWDASPTAESTRPVPASLASTSISAEPFCGTVAESACGAAGTIVAVTVTETLPVAVRPLPSVTT